MPAPLRLADYDFALPPGCIAQRPLPERDAARLLVLDRASWARSHRSVRDLPELLAPGDLLVVNATRVEPARLRGHKVGGGGRAEALLLEPVPGAAGCYRALVKVTGRLRPGLALVFEREGRELPAQVEARAPDGCVVLRFAPEARPHSFGEMPLPPYIRRAEADPADGERYQTVYARAPGSVAAPTAGLHLSAALLERLEAAGVARAEVVLHVGLGTFRPLGERELASGALHPERYELPEAAARAVAEARARGGRVVAVGTTSARVLESCARPGGQVAAGAGETRLFLKPGDRFAVVDVLLTNFHLPRSSLLLLVAAFAGRERILEAYAEAVARGYRFYSYGDAMLIT